MKENKGLRKGQGAKKGKKAKNVLSSVNEIINETQCCIDVFSKLHDKNVDPGIFLKAHEKLEEKFTKQAQNKAEEQSGIMDVDQILEMYGAGSGKKKSSE